MAKIVYTLTCDAKNVTVVDGKAHINFTQEIDAEEVSDAEASGECQSNMLWECFEHSFAAYDDQGWVISYNDNGEKV